MRKIALGLVVLVSLLCVEALGAYNSQAKARELDEKCSNGDSEACMELGNNYYYGWGGFSQDLQKAIFYYERVCKKGNFANACTTLGIIYEESLPRAQRDYKKALKFYTLGCEGGGEIGCHGVLDIHAKGHGVPKNPAKGAAYLKKLCDSKNNWGACYWLGRYEYERGNRSGAVRYLKKVCELGVKDPRADTAILEGACEMYDELK
ncbi:MAG: tetratricopeptide repeat protein [Wolinella sp.]